MKVLSVSIKKILLLGGLSLLCGCCDNLPYSDPTAPKLPRKVANTSDSSRINLQKKLRLAGVKVVSTGQDYLISVPSSLLFANQSPRLLPKSHGILKEIICFIKEFRKIAVTVTSFTGQTCCYPQAQALTALRSQVISDYLWDKKIDSRFIFAQGAGNLKPIDNGSFRDCDSSSRIEITFRNAIV